jgi:hypothetical protein
MTRFHHAGRPQLDLPLRLGRSGGMATQPRRNGHDGTDDDHRQGDGAPPMFVEGGKSVRALAACPEDAQRDKDGSDRESDATHPERVVGPLASDRVTPALWESCRVTSAARFSCRV